MANSALDNYYISAYGPSGTNTLAHYWPLSEASGSIVDLIAALNGTAGAGITFGQPSILPTTDGKTCLSATGASSANVALSSNLGGAPISYELWFRPITINGSTIAQFFQNGGASNGTWVGSLYTPNRLGLFLNGGAGVAYFPWSPVVGTTYHIVITCNGSAATTIVYINGVAQTMTTQSAYAAPSTANGALMGSNTSAAGAQGYGEKLAVYNAILTPTQVTNNYNAGLNGPPATGNVLIPSFSGGMQELSGNIRG